MKWIFALLMLVFVACSSERGDVYMTDSKELDGKVLAVCSGNASYESDFKRMFPNAKIKYFTNYFDTFIAVTKGLADGAFIFHSFEKILQESYPNLRSLATDMDVPIVAAFAANASEQLRRDFDDFAESALKSGLIDSLKEKWVDGYPSSDVVDFSNLPEGKTFKLAFDVLNPPYEYLKDGKYAGFELALVYEFCRQFGYKPQIETLAYDAVVAGVSAGKYDMGLGDYGYTEERSEGMIFSKPYLLDKVGFMVLRPGEVEKLTFAESMKQSFYKNFIKEDRWLLVLRGLGVTLLITVLSVLLGSLFGFGLFLVGRNNRVLDKVICVVYESLESLPILVVLMVAYYVVFGKSDIDGVWVSVIVFGLMFLLSTYCMLKHGVNSVPVGQMEAALALGYTEREGLFKVVLPQAAKVFMPMYRGNVIAYLKATAIVGYVAVNDLTRAGDVIRSRTFEAFFPLLAVALIYYVVARLLIFLLNRIRYGEVRR